MEDVAIHRSGGNDVYKVVPKDKEIHSVFFYKNLFYKNVEAEINQNVKNV